MTAAMRTFWIKEWVTASRLRQGLPPVIESVEVLDRVAALIAQAKAASQ